MFNSSTLASPLQTTYGFTLFVDLTAKVVILIALAATAAFLLRRSAAATRHLVWLCALSATLLLPAVSPFVPSRLTTYWKAPVLPRLPAPGNAPDTAAADVASASRGPRLEASKLAGLTRDTELTGRSIIPRSAPTPTISWVLVLTALYGFGALTILFQVVLGIVGISRLGRESEGFAPSSIPALTLTELTAQLGIRRVISLRRHNDAIPMTWGWRRPIVLLPPDAENWEPERLRVVLLHELAHIARHDWPTQMLTHVICAIYWYNPLVWWAASRVRAESERACDDRVLLAGVASDAYAYHLLDIVRLSRDRRAGNVRLTTPMARPASLEARLRSLLDSEIPHRSVQRGVSYAAIAAAVVACLVLNLFRLREASANGTRVQAQDMIGTVITKVEPSIRSFTKTLPGGGTVRLVQVSNLLADGPLRGQKPRRMYWQPDGTPLASSLLPAIVDDMASQMVRKIPPHPFEFAFVWTGLSEPPLVKSIGHKHTIYAQIHIDSVPGQHVQILCSNDPKESFEIVSPTEPWKVEARILLSHAVGSADQPETDFKKLTIAKNLPHFGRVYPFNQHTSCFDLLIAAPTTRSREVFQQILLFDSKNAHVPANTVMSQQGNNCIWETLNATRSIPARAAYAVFEKRHYARVTIDHVALQPKGSVL